MLGASLAATAAFAQTGSGASVQDATGLNIPQGARFLAANDQSVRRANAIVNGTVITGTEVDHRLALMMIGSDAKVPPEEMQRVRAQVLRNLVDETLQIQEAQAREIKVEQKEIDTAYNRYVQSLGQTPQQFAAMLRAAGSSEASVKRQIHGEIAWNRLQSSRIAPFVNVSDDEVEAIIERLNASRGAQEYKVSEIFISATPETAAEARANAQRIVQQLRAGGSFLAYARQFSEASTAAVGGDLGWVRAEQLPEALAQTVQRLPVGQVSDPIAIPGGFSVVAVEDSRQVLGANPRDAVLSLKQMTLATKGLPRNQVEGRIQQLVRTTQTMGGCGRAEEAAAAIGAEVVTNDQVRARDLPGPLQDTLLALAVGQSTAPFGTVEERISVLVLCGRDDPEAPAAISADAVRTQIEEQRVNLRARRYLRDLRRDAVVEYQG
jgi:peptidyl-prolyl cis-trans isomerase SurA